MKINKLNLILVFRREELLLIQHDAGIYSTTDLVDSLMKNHSQGESVLKVKFLYFVCQSVQIPRGF